MSRVVVYSYACGRRCDLDEFTRVQSRLGDECYNDLVAIEQRHEEAKAAAWLEHPEVDMDNQKVEELKGDVKELNVAWKKSKSQKRDRIGDPELKEALDAVRVELKEAQKQLKATKEKRNRDLAHRFKELWEERRQAEKATYAYWSQERGLYWANYNLSRRQWMVASKQVSTARKNGLPAALRPRSRGMEGLIGVQLQRSPGTPPETELTITVQEEDQELSAYKIAKGTEFLMSDAAGNTLLFVTNEDAVILPNEKSVVIPIVATERTKEWNAMPAGQELVPVTPFPFKIHAVTTTMVTRGKNPDPLRTPTLLAQERNKWRNVVRLPTQQKKKHRAPVTIRSGSTEDGEDTFFTIPDVIWHRPLPENGDICDVKVVRKNKSGAPRLWVQFTVELPSSEPSTAPGSCAIDTGWRMMPDGSIRVAVWRGKLNGQIDVPQHLKNAILLSPEGGEVRIPPEWLGAYRYVDTLRSIRDKNMEALREEIKDDPSIEPFLDEGERIAQWQSPKRFARLAYRMRSSGLPVAEKLEAWRKQNRHLHTWETAQREKVINWRADLFGVLAARLCELNHLIAIEQSYVAKVTKKSEDDSIADDVTRKLARLAAPFELTTKLRNAASRLGAEVKEIPGTDTTITHAACGYKNEPGIGRTSSMIKCQGCGETYDQDENSCWILLRRAEAES